MSDKKIDLNEIIDKAVELLVKDEKLKKQFKDEPVKVLEKILKIDLPDELIEPLIDGIKLKIGAEQIGQAVDLLKKFF